MANVTHKVVKGDTLWALAQKYNTTVNELVRLNNIKDPDYIVVGQVLIVSGTAATVATNKSSKANILVFGLQTNTDRTMYATWSWDKSNTKEYQTKWWYDTGDVDKNNKTIWFVGNDTKVTDKQSVYSAPSNAKRVKFQVKPISATRKVNGKDKAYWTASWSTAKTYTFAAEQPEKPSTPTVKIEGTKLTAELNNIASGTTHVKFEVVKNNKTIFSTGSTAINKAYASYSCTVEIGGQYKVRAMTYINDLYSEWSEYSNNISTIPATPTEITTIRANSETSVYLEWSATTGAKTYEIEYATEKDKFDNSDQTSKKSGIEFAHYEVAGLESGDEYFFRVRAVNNQGNSGWTGIKSAIIGKKPAPPTTWSSTTTVITGEELKLYWLHNAEDNSKATYSELELTIDGLVETHTIANDKLTEEEKNDTNEAKVYIIDTKGFTEGSQIKWRVRTAGITKEYGDWSTERVVDIYAPVTIVLKVTDSSDNAIEKLNIFPFKINALAGPNTQVPIGYHLAITSNEVYETVDSMGNIKYVNQNEEVYSKYFDISTALNVELSASDVDLENNISYTITCKVTMDSGLSGEKTAQLLVAWEDEEYEPNAEIGIDFDTLSASIRPYCEDVYGNLIPDISLSVYRREFDGTFTELMTGIDNESNTFITDPHPALDYARYRIVAITKTTGAVSYCDIDGVPINEKAIIIQWDEQWSTFDTSNEDEMEQPTWSGSLLRLPYNIDISDSNSADVSLVKYIGRKRPVSYYGTQIGSKSSWSTDIPKSDHQTLYGLRRLAIWMGDVYVREPSGSGYWANISVSFNQNHNEVTIPVSLDITRVEGGI